MSTKLNAQNHSEYKTVGENYVGPDYKAGMDRLMTGVRAGEVVIITFSFESCDPKVFPLDIESAFDCVLDGLGYTYETVYSDDSMIVWFGVNTSDTALLADQVVGEIGKIAEFEGLRVIFGGQTFLM